MASTKTLHIISCIQVCILIEIETVRIRHVVEGGLTENWGNTIKIKLKGNDSKNFYMDLNCELMMDLNGRFVLIQDSWTMRTPITHIGESRKQNSKIGTVTECFEKKRNILKKIEKIRKSSKNFSWIFFPKMTLGDGPKMLSIG